MIKTRLDGSNVAIDELKDLLNNKRGVYHGRAETILLVKIT